MSRLTRRHGMVERFDEPVGLGIVKGEDGAEYPFHCTQIADDSRTVPTGVTVIFEVVAGHQGKWEAAGIEPFSPPLTPNPRTPNARTPTPAPPQAPPAGQP